MSSAPRLSRGLLLVLFAASGFSALIYESIWSRYLGLFLGHAAYAQTLVLAIFMGGMALGSWLVSRLSSRLTRPLETYALAEAIIGLGALAFHPIFVGATGTAYASLFPHVGSTALLGLFKWSLGGALILPQSVLLGATFPLMSAGLIRRFPKEPGESLAALYFVNSLGAAIGVLVAGFVLVERAGLPGTLRLAGLVNLGVALVVAVVARGLARAPAEDGSPEAQAFAATPAGVWDRAARGLLATALLTGASSFVYEIGWIRMLCLVLGSSTHAFELMLAAFLAGLACGGLWIRRRIDRLARPIAVLGLVQLAMGACAAGTLVAYNSSFDLMRVLMGALSRTPAAYHLFNVGSHGIALATMFPATFCAGMTLPLVTTVLLRRGGGESSIGATYAANTIGAILGLVAAVLGLPLLGLKGIVLGAAALDAALGVALCVAAGGAWRRVAAPAAAALTAVGVIVIATGVRFDGAKMMSGVYRIGTLYAPGSIEILYHEDGRTASVDLVKHADGEVSLRTNGKVDAGLNPAPDGPPGDDEATCVLLGAIPLAHHPAPREVANIGLGSGLTVEVLLGSPAVERVDTIEIEPAMVEAARRIGPRVAAVFTDPRSRITIDDAKSFFAAAGRRYDVIVSEPSNPWVSGVADLFSEEFYAAIRERLNPGGLLVQWLQTYEIDLDLVATVMKALGRHFADYVVYAPNDGEIIVVARPDGPVPPPELRRLGGPGVVRELGRVDIRVPRDFMLRRLGRRAVLGPLFESRPGRANSDFFPVLDLGAERTRFLGSTAVDLPRLGNAPLPVLEMLDDVPSSSHTLWVTPSRHLTRTLRTHQAIAVHRFFVGEAPDVQGPLRTHQAIAVQRFLAGEAPDAQGPRLEGDVARNVALAAQYAQACIEPGVRERWLENVLQVARVVLPQLAAEDAARVAEHLGTAACRAALAPAEKAFIELLLAVGRRDAGAMARLAPQALAGPPDVPRERARYVLAAGMLGELALGRPAEAQRLWTTHRPQLFGDDPPQELFIGLLVALAPA